MCERQRCNRELGDEVGGLVKWFTGRLPPLTLFVFLTLSVSQTQHPLRVLCESAGGSTRHRRLQTTVEVTGRGISFTSHLRFVLDHVHTNLFKKCFQEWKQLMMLQKSVFSFQQWNKWLCVSWKGSHIMTSSQRIISSLCSSPQLAERFCCLSAYALQFMVCTTAVLVHSLCSRPPCVLRYTAWSNEHRRARNCSQSWCWSKQSQKILNFSSSSGQKWD